MIKLTAKGVFYKDGRVFESANVSKDEARKNTIAYRILNAHNISGNDNALKIKFDAMVSHDITYVGIIQTARASGMKEFPLPYAMTNCHNSLCAVGGTINEDDHAFGLSAAKKYGGVYVPANMAVIHQYAREALASCGGMILGSDSHTRYGALGCMGVGEGGPELVKQLLSILTTSPSRRLSSSGSRVRCPTASARTTRRWPCAARSIRTASSRTRCSSSPAPASKTCPSISAWRWTS